MKSGKKYKSKCCPCPQEEIQQCLFTIEVSFGDIMALHLVSNPFIPKNGPSQRGKVEEKAKKTIVFGAGLIISFLMTVQ